jgi:hypothetical protein
MRRGRASAVRLWVPVVVVVALVAWSTVSVASAGVAAGPAIEEVTLPDGSVADRADGRLYVWRSALDSVAVRIDPGGESARVELCVEGEDSPNGTTVRIGCRKQQVFERNGTVRLPIDRWVANQSGPRDLSITLRNPDDGTEFDRYEVSIVVLVRGGDLDGDGLTDEREIGIGTAVDLRDTDEDGLVDGTEVSEYGTDPLSNDTDDDGLRDAPEIDGSTNATDPDTDGDGLDDGPEVNEYGTDPTVVDTDGDGLEDGPEVNGYGTDPTTADTDGEGLADGAEVNEYGTDPTDPDTDGDLLTDPLEASIGTGPTSGWIPLIPVIGILTAVLGVIAVVWVRGVLVPTSDDESGGVGEGGGRDDASGAAGGGSSDGTTTIGAASDDTPVLTDEDRVRQLLRENGGRLQQGEFVERTDWSKSKVSRLLSGMEEDGEIEKIAQGRGEHIALPGEAPVGGEGPVEGCSIRARPTADCGPVGSVIGPRELPGNDRFGPVSPVHRFRGSRGRFRSRPGHDRRDGSERPRGGVVRARGSYGGVGQGSSRTPSAPQRVHHA